MHSNSDVCQVERRPSDEAVLQARYGDLLERFDRDLVLELRGLLRHAVVRPDVPPGNYALVPRTHLKGGRDWVRYRVEDFGGEARLAGFRVVFRRGGAGMYEPVPRRQVRSAFDRIAAAPELAAARYRAICERCDGRLSGEAARERGTCEGCHEAVRFRRVAYWHAKKQREQERRREIDGFRRRVLAALARHPGGGMWRSQVAAALGVEAAAVGSQRTYRFNLALAELTEAGEVEVELGMGPTVRGPCRQRRFRLAKRRDLQVITGGSS